MAIEKVDTGISDADMFRDAMSEPKAEPEKVEPKVDATGRVHDELGRFAPKEADAAPIQQQEPKLEEPKPTPDNEGAQVPSWRLRELREQREAAEARARERETEAIQTRQQLAALQRQLEQLQQPKQEPVDFFADPNAALEQRLTPVEGRMEQLASRLILRASKAEAVAVHGAQVVQEMEQAIGKAMQEGHPEMHALSIQMRNSDDPVGLAMNWYKREKLTRETGGDITAYRTKLQDELLKDPAFLAKALDAARAQAGQPGKPTQIQMPPSLNKASGSGGNEESEGDLSNESLWASARPLRGRK